MTDTYKLMIVEDERWEREGLLDFVDWQALGIEVVGAACDGIEGLEMGLQLRPDIVITDIRMPGMDGLEMSSKLKEFMPSIRIIILSGYGDFNYARQAMLLQASHYVLKPVEEEPLLEALSRVVAECSQERAKQERDDELESLLQGQQRAMLQRQAEELLEGRLQPSEWNALAAGSGFRSVDGRYAVFMALSGGWSREQLDQAAGRPQLAVYTDRLGGEWTIVLPLDNGETSESLAKKWTERFAASGALYRPERGAFGIGGEAHSLAEVRRARDEAFGALQFGVFWGLTGLLGAERLDAERSRAYAAIGGLLPKVSASAKDIVFAVNALDDEKAVRAHQEMMEALEACCGTELDFIRSHLIGLQYELTLLAGGLEGEQDLAKEIGGVLTFRQLRADSAAYLQRILKAMREKRGSKEEYIVKKLNRLVETAYMQPDLGLKRAAEEVFLSPNYLGAIYKKATGQSFHDYVTSCRMNKAKELLGQPGNTVSRVAQEVGISGTSYFVTLFKSAYGMTPGEYQEMLHRK